MKKIELLCYWGQRSATVGEFCSQSMDFFRWIGEYMNEVSCWRIANGKVEIDFVNDNTVAALERWLKFMKRSLQIRDRIKDANENTTIDVGFIQTSCPYSNPQLMVSLSMGRTSDIPNNIIVSIPEEKASFDLVQGLLEEIINRFDPWWACATDSNVLSQLSKNSGYWFGWFSYFNQGISVRLPKIPADFEQKSLGTGTLIINTREVFDFQNPEHIARAFRLRDLFSESGFDNAFFEV
ncbi:MAG: immunity 52 family protein [Chitinophagales bacterium]|nr:immunity 52 family protein [Chitinophagales bacterium]